MRNTEISFTLSGARGYTRAGGDGMRFINHIRSVSGARSGAYMCRCLGTEERGLKFTLQTKNGLVLYKCEK